MSNAWIVVVPTYNERENIFSLLPVLLNLALDLDILVVDDNSPDGTASAVQDLMKRIHRGSQRIHLLERPKKLGLGSAYRDGFKWCLEREYERIFQMDADFSHKPKDLIRLAEASESADVALGTRYIHGGGTSGWPLRRELLSRCAKIHARTLTGQPYHDLTGGFKCWHRNVLEKIQVTSTTSQGYAFQIETTTLAHRAGFKITEVPIVFKERALGQSKLSGNVISEALAVVFRLAIKRS